MNELHRDGRAATLEPAPFVGGMHMLSEGRTVCFTVDLEPGRYLFVSEYTAIWASSRR